MDYINICEGIFLRRINRFVAEVEICGITELCHVINTGRCREILIPGVKVYLSAAVNPARMTRYDLISVWKGDTLINIDSLAPNRVFGKYLQGGEFLSNVTLIKAEARFGGSRFDFYVEANEEAHVDNMQKAFIEVKGVTLEDNGVAMFPDAPTLRGVKHLKELADCISQGYAAYVVFIVQMTGVDYFTPNRQMHPEFAVTLAEAVHAGVQVCAYDCIVTPESLIIKGEIPFKL